jgi:hypothetical protein
VGKETACKIGNHQMYETNDEIHSHIVFSSVGHVKAIQYGKSLHTFAWAI